MKNNLKKITHAKLQNEKEQKIPNLKNRSDEGGR